MTKAFKVEVFGEDTHFFILATAKRATIKWCPLDSDAPPDHEIKKAIEDAVAELEAIILALEIKGDMHND